MGIVAIGLLPWNTLSSKLALDKLDVVVYE